MLNTLDNFHRRIAEGIDAIRQQCDKPAPAPDPAALGAARLSLTRISAARSRYITEKAIPRLVQEFDLADQSELSILQRQLNGNRLVSSRHVGVWSSVAIQSDWAGYRRAARDIWAMMEEQMNRERLVLGEPLRHLRPRLINLTSTDASDRTSHSLANQSG